MPDSDARRELLSEAMRTARLGRGVTLSGLATQIGVSKGFLSEVERGIKLPSPRVARAYDHLLHCDGVLIGLREDYQRSASQESSVGAGGRPGLSYRHVPGDAAELVSESLRTIELTNGGSHVKTWTLRNAGSVVWEGRRLQRAGRLGGRELPASEPSVPIPRTAPGETVTLRVTLSCAREAGTRIVRFMVVDADGRLRFPGDAPALTAEVSSLPGQLEWRDSTSVGGSSESSSRAQA